MESFIQQNAQNAGNRRIVKKKKTASKKSERILEEKLFTVLSHPAESPFKRPVNDNNISSVSHKSTMTFLCSPVPLSVSSQANLKFRAVQKMNLTSVKQNRFMADGLGRRQRNQVETGLASGSCKHTFTRHPPSQTHTSTLPHSRDAKAHAAPVLSPARGLFLESNPSRNPIDAVSRCCPTLASESIRTPVARRQ